MCMVVLFFNEVMIVVSGWSHLESSALNPFCRLGRCLNAITNLMQCVLIIEEKEFSMYQP